MSVTFYAHDLRRPVHTGLDISLSNANAFDLLTWLGVECEDGLCGVLDPADLLGRIATARAVGGVGFDDTGTATIAEGGDGHATMVHCGRPAGYFAHRASELEALARAAQAAGAQVTYA